VVTSTVCISGAEFVRLPVKTDRDIPKKLIFEAMRLLDGLTVKAPVKAGDIIVPDILNTGANFVATRSMEPVSCLIQTA
jgi:CxxC motif-containing protein